MKPVFLLAVAQASQPSYEEWAAKYGIVTNDVTVKEKYYANVARIEELNADTNQTATFAVNQFSGMTFDEFASIYLTAKEEDVWRLTEQAEVSDMTPTCCYGGPSGGTNTCANKPGYTPLGVCNTDWSKHCSSNADCGSPGPGPAPAPGPAPGPSIDWDVTPVKNQGGCGSCWAFSTMGAIEHVHKLNTGETVDLSEQQLVDCTSGTCAGGNPYQAMNEIRGGDIYPTSSYPYRGDDGNCRAQGPASGVHISGYTGVQTNDYGYTNALQSSSISVTLYADDLFQHYSGGVLTADDTGCHINHAVLLTGYGSNFWKIKNSWGTGWGEHGFMRFRRTLGGCGPFGLFYQQGVVPVEVRSEAEGVVV